MDENTNSALTATPNPDPMEQVREQQIVPFLGDQLTTALTTTGNIYISLPGICQALGLNGQAQTRRVQRNAVLARGLQRILLATAGGPQAVFCLRIDKLGLFMAGLETSRLRPEFQGKIIAYQEELAPLATRLFLRTVGFTTRDFVPPDDIQGRALAAQIDHLTAVVGFLQEHLTDMQAAAGAVQGIVVRLDQAVRVLESLTDGQQQITARQDATEDQVARIDERTAGLSPAHKRAVQTLVNRMIRATQGTRRPLDYSTIYGRLKHRFNVAAYGEIADEQFDQVMAHLRDQLRHATDGSAPEQRPLF
ncbi:MAG: ORF6C domain-containing protein [Chloroflexota bacterium]|nr:ORF6C domain-containing protein [Chloroflexota bacterium]